MDDKNISWVTVALTLVMVGIYLVDPTLSPLTYSVLAPWMHAGLDHLFQNLLVFVLLDAWAERRMGQFVFLLFAALFSYLALYLPVVLEYGGLSRGASGLTMALMGYVIPVLVVILAGYTESVEIEARDVAVGTVTLLVVTVLTADALDAVRRFVGIEPQPDSVAVTAHVTGLVLGVLWFSWRAWRHGLVDA